MAKTAGNTEQSVLLREKTTIRTLAEKMENEEKARITLQFLIEQPAVMFADEVFVPTEGMRAVYIDWLCRLGGESLRDIWERKIQYGSVVCH